MDSKGLNPVHTLARPLLPPRVSTGDAVPRFMAARGPGALLAGIAAFPTGVAATHATSAAPSSALPLAEAAALLLPEGHGRTPDVP